MEQLAETSQTVEESQRFEVTTNDSHQTGHAIEESQDSQTTRESQTPEDTEESQTAEGSRMEAQVGESDATHTTIIPEPSTQAAKHKTVEAVCERQVSALVDEDERHIQGIMQIHLVCHSTLLSLVGAYVSLDGCLPLKTISRNNSFINSQGSSSMSDQLRDMYKVKSLHATQYSLLIVRVKIHQSMLVLSREHSPGERLDFQCPYIALSFIFTLFYRSHVVMK